MIVKYLRKTFSKVFLFVEIYKTTGFDLKNCRKTIPDVFPPKVYDRNGFFFCFVFNVRTENIMRRINAHRKE